MANKLPIAHRCLGHAGQERITLPPSGAWVGGSVVGKLGIASGQNLISWYNGAVKPVAGICRGRIEEGDRGIGAGETCQRIPTGQVGGNLDMPV